MALTVPYPTLGTGLADSTKIDSNFTNVVAKFNQGIVNADINSSAAIDVTKLSARYEYLPVNVVLATGIASNDVLFPIYNDGKDAWTVVSTQWATCDTGTPSGVIGIQWGVLDGGAAGTIAARWTNAITVDSVSITGAANVCTQGVDSSPTGATLTWGGGGVYRALRFYMSTVDAAAGSPIYITLTLKRSIAT